MKTNHIRSNETIYHLITYDCLYFNSYENIFFIFSLQKRSLICLEGKTFSYFNRNVRLTQYNLFPQVENTIPAAKRLVSIVGIFRVFFSIEPFALIVPLISRNTYLRLSRTIRRKKASRQIHRKSVSRSQLAFHHQLLTTQDSSLLYVIFSPLTICQSK